MKIGDPVQYSADTTFESGTGHIHSFAENDNRYLRVRDLNNGPLIYMLKNLVTPISDEDYFRAALKNVV